MPESATHSFSWIPGQGPDRDALDRMVAEFPKPTKPMGEAWFMAQEREMYPRLLGDLDTLQDSEIEKALEEIASGTSSFGRYEEWVQWYHYLLPRLIERQWSRSYYNQAELLFTAFMTQHPDSDRDNPYPQFRIDALATLGRYIMSPTFWPDGKLDPVGCLSKWTGPTGIAGWFDTGGLLSASLFFCIKYLSPQDVEDWFGSVITIPDRYWQLQVITWLVGAHSILTDEIHNPAEFPETSSCGITWSWSHVLNGRYKDAADQPMVPVPFLPEHNRAIVLRLARGWEVETFLMDFMTDPEAQPIASEITGIPERFLHLYRSIAAPN